MNDKIISMPMVHSTQTMHLSSAKINTISKWTETNDTRHVGVPFCVSKIISMPVVHLAQTVHYLVLRVTISPKTDRNELPLDPHHKGVPSGVPKMISMPVVHLEQTVHLSCAEIKTISKRIETSFYLTYVTYEYS
jgi:hypothetical protein